MPSPFPGMDPFIESQKWEDFHHSAISVMRELIAPQVADWYIVNVQERVYLQEVEGDERLVIPDVSVAATEQGCSRSTSFPAGTVAVATAPVECLLPKTESHQEGFLEIRTTDNGHLVTVIELLSPSNKQRGTQGARKYLTKRKALLQTTANLVEIDLLRVGQRLPMASPLPVGDYFALVSRGRSRPKSSVYSWRLPDRMPAIPIPLASGQNEPPVDLQNVLDLVYDRALYRLSMKYDRPLVPQPTTAEEWWLKTIVDAPVTLPPR